jgi:Na+(H+)/acetate symporter ActP
MLIGPAGGTVMMLMLFMAITSTGSAECIAVSSLVTYDIYRKYCRPDANNQQIMMWSRVVTLIFGLLMGTVAAIFAAFRIEMPDLDEMGEKQYTTLSMGWVYVFMGNAIGSAVAPVFFAITWKDANKWGAILGAWGGLVGSFIVWFITTNAYHGEITYFTLATDEPLLCSNLTAILLSAFIHVVFSLIAPQNYDWAEMGKKIQLVPGCPPANVPAEELSEEFLGPALAWSWKYGGCTTIFLLIVWPLFFSFPWGVMPKGIYGLWVAVAFAWGWLGAFYIIVAPIVEYAPYIKAALTCKKFSESAGSATPSEPAVKIESSVA